MDDDDDLKSNGISLLPTSSLFLPNRPNLIHSLWSLFFFLRQVDGTVASLMGQTAPGLPGFSGLWPIEVVVGLLSSHGWTTDCTPFRKSVGFVLPRMPELTEEQAMNQFFSMSVSNSATAKGLWVFGPLFGAFAQTVWIQIVWTKRFESDNVAYKFQLPFQIESRQACGTSMKAWGLNASCLAPLCYLPPGLSLLRGHWEWDDSAGRFWEGMARSIVCLFLLKDKDLVVEVWGSFKWCFRD